MDYVIAAILIFSLLRGFVKGFVSSFLILSCFMLVAYFLYKVCGLSGILESVDFLSKSKVLGLIDENIIEKIVGLIF